MKLIDLSREIYHKMPRLPNHPTITISAFTTHEEKRVADGYTFSSAVTSLNMGDHSGTHIDAPIHFDEKPSAKSIDQIPLENFFTKRFALTCRTSRSRATSASLILMRQRKPRASTSVQRTPCCCTWISIAGRLAPKATSPIFQA